MLYFGASLTGQAFPERDPVGRGAKQQDGVVGRGDAVSHYQGVEVDRLTGRALLLRRRLRDGEGARGEMLAGLRPGQRRVVLRVAGLADEDDHVPHSWPFAGALDEILLDAVMGRRLDFRGSQLFRAIARDEAPPDQVLGAFRID